MAQETKGQQFLFLYEYYVYFFGGFLTYFQANAHSSCSFVLWTNPHADLVLFPLVEADGLLRAKKQTSHNESFTVNRQTNELSDSFPWVQETHGTVSYESGSFGESHWARHRVCQHESTVNEFKRHLRFIISLDSTCD